jgi:hypothetical protein
MMMTDVSFGAFSNHLANRLPLSISGLEVELGAPLNSSNFKGRVEGCAHTLITDIAVRKAIVIDFAFRVYAFGWAFEYTSIIFSIETCV